MGESQGWREFRVGTLRRDLLLELSGGQRLQVQPNSVQFVVGHLSEPVPRHEFGIQQFSLWISTAAYSVYELGPRPTPRCAPRSNVGGVSPKFSRRDNPSGQSLSMTKSANLSKVLAIFGGDCGHWWRRTRGVMVD